MAFVVFLLALLALGDGAVMEAAGLLVVAYVVCVLGRRGVGQRPWPFTIRFRGPGGGAGWHR